MVTVTIHCCFVANDTHITDSKKFRGNYHESPAGLEQFRIELANVYNTIMGWYGSRLPKDLIDNIEKDIVDTVEIAANCMTDNRPMLKCYINRNHKSKMNGSLFFKYGAEASRAISK